jgi:hypothetical protein
MATYTGHLMYSMTGKESKSSGNLLVKYERQLQQPSNQRQRETDTWMAGCNIHPFTTKLLVVSGRNKCINQSSAIIIHKYVYFSH